MPSTFSFFLTWWGVILLAALDSSLLFYLPFGNDALVVYLAARNPALFWLYPLLTTAGSTAGAAGTYWIGKKAGEIGVGRMLAPGQLDRMQRRVSRGGALAISLPAVLPPPFPLTPFVLTCGALAVDPKRFFLVFGGSRLVRFGAEAALARQYGERIVRVLESDLLQLAIGAFIVVAIAGTVLSAVVLWKRTRGESRRA